MGLFVCERRKIEDMLDPLACSKKKSLSQRREKVNSVCKRDEKAWLNSEDFNFEGFFLTGGKSALPHPYINKKMLRF
jgi:hypothetical protein